MNSMLSVTEMYKGQSCFLICDGPSFSNVDTTRLSDSGILTMGVNNSPGTFRPNLWCSVDSPITFLDSVKTDPKILKFCPQSYRRKYSTPFFGFTTNTDFSANRFLSEQSVCYGGTNGGRSVMMAAIKVLYVLGIRNIFLLGVDFKMKDGEANYHFDQETTGHMVKTNNKSYDKLSDRFDKLVPIFKENGLNVYNCNPDSKLKSFEFIDLEDAIKMATEGKTEPSKETTLGKYDNPKIRDIAGRRIKKAEGEPEGGGRGRRRTRRKGNQVGKRGLIHVNPEEQIVINGMSRSGTHAFSNWVCSQKSGNVQFRNDLHFSGGKICNPDSIKVPERFYTLPSLEYKKGSSSEPIDCFVYTLENCTGDQITPCKKVTAKKTIKIQLLRDPYNLASSLATHVENNRRFWFWDNCTVDGKIDDLRMYNFSKAWSSHANIYLNDDSVIPVSYNLWKESKEYRDEIAEKIGILSENRTDDSMNLVPVNGGGSSFDKLKKDGDGCSMETDKRWEKYKDDDWFKNFFRNHIEMKELSDKIFGEVVSL